MDVRNLAMHRHSYCVRQRDGSRYDEEEDHSQLRFLGESVCILNRVENRRQADARMYPFGLCPEIAGTKICCAVYRSDDQPKTPDISSLMMYLDDVPRVHTYLTRFRFPTNISVLLTNWACRMCQGGLVRDGLQARAKGRWRSLCSSNFSLCPCEHNAVP